MRIALHQPDIAGNVGTILRLAACMGVAVDVIEPAGFPWSDRALARAGMDYAAAAPVRRHVFSPGIWWIGSTMNRSGSDVQILAMYS